MPPSPPPERQRNSRRDGEETHAEGCRESFIVYFQIHFARRVRLGGRVFRKVAKLKFSFSGPACGARRRNSLDYVCLIDRAPRHAPQAGPLNSTSSSQTK